MRIRLIKGKQKELILNAKENLTWNELAQKININPDYLNNDLKNERSLLTKDSYDKLCQISETNFNKFILEKLPVNWGQSKGGQNSRGSIIDIKIPEKNEKLAELIGIILGDGNINYYKRGKKIGVYQVTIAGDKRLDKDYHLNRVSLLFKELFGVKVKEKISKKNNGRFLVVSSKQLVNFFIENGLKSGDKIKNQVTIPSWIKENPIYLKACIRGLFDTDGCVYELLPHWPGLYQINLSCYNLVLINDVRNGLLSLEINCSKANKNKLYVTKKTELRKFLKQIGFRNSRHLNKIKNWNL